MNLGTDNRLIPPNLETKKISRPNPAYFSYFIQVILWHLLIRLQYRFYYPKVYSG